MSEGEAPAPAGPKGIDAFYSKFSSYATAGTGEFASFVFLVLAIGIAVGFFVSNKLPELAVLTILGSLALGLIAHYNREIATILLIAALAFIALVG